MKQDYSKNGCHLLPRAFDSEQVSILRDELSVFEGKISSYGVRDLMCKVPYIKHIASSPPLMDIAKEILGENARPVRSVFFDKLPEANWNVAWHQDTSIALKARHEIAGFGLWSKKQGIVHAEPPEKYLKSTLTLRIHLDKANTESGVLRVVPGTHSHGRVRSDEILKIVENSKIVECNASEGDLLLMNPLLFHSSRKATNPTHRRIIHIEYSAMTLPDPLEWYECA
ncbi:MAG: phytanoyl-CoA dioxygenase family protein [Candidatus Thiodiazotropha sp.]